MIKVLHPQGGDWLVPGSLRQISSPHKRLRTKTIRGRVTPRHELLPGNAVFMIAPPAPLILQYAAKIFGPADWREIHTSPIVRVLELRSLDKSPRVIVHTTSGSIYLITYDE